MGGTQTGRARIDRGGERGSGSPTALVVGLLAVLALTLPSALATAGMTRVSVSTDGVQADGGSMSPAITPDGRYVAFVSGATNLVADDTNSRWDVFVHDRETGETTRASVTNSGAQANDSSWGPTISADGRYVAFTSNASNLVAGDTNGLADVFVHDCATGQTIRVSVASDGAEVVGYSDQPAISADGRYVAFRSTAADLVANDTNGTSDAFVHDTTTGETTRVSLSSYGAQSTGEIEHIGINADGRYVAFGSNAPDLVGGDTNAAYDIFVHDCETGETECVSVTGDGTPGDRGSDEFSVSADGRYVAFTSDATDLVAGDTNNQLDVFVYDRQTGQMERVSVTSSGLQATDSSLYPSISPDGSCVSFYSADDGLAPGDTNTWGDVYVHDRRTGRTERISVGLGGVDSNDSSYDSAASTEGRYVAFRSGAWNLVTGDTNAAEDIFVCERPVAAFTADVTSGLVPLTVNFTDLSTGDPASWAWDFGDGSTAGGQNPSHEYATEGTFSVSLTVTCIYGSDTETEPDYITVSAVPAPVAAFSASTTLGYVPLDVTFTDASTNSPTLWIWDFGDSTGSNDQSPAHTYNDTGSYTVSLTVSNAGGFDIETKVDYIKVVAPAQAAFSATPTSGPPPLIVSFTDASTGTIDTWEWDFGDSTGSSDQDPIHQYAAGSYDVSLEVTNAMGSDTETKLDYITVAPPPPVAAFSGTPTLGAAPLEVAFTDASTGVIDSWEWNFGDAASCTDQNPTHQYAGVGVYAVSLTVTNLGGSDTETKPDYIQAVAPISADFSATGTLGMVPVETSFTDLSSGTPTAWSWSFGDGTSATVKNPTRTYTVPGYYTVALTASKPGASDTESKVGFIAAGFTDTPPESNAFYQILACVQAGVVQGYPWDQTYKPARTVSRGQMAIYIARALVTPSGDAAVPEPPPGTQTFPDVGPENVAYYKYVEYCAAKNIVQGFWDGNYKPDKMVNRGQMAMYIARALVQPGGDAAVPPDTDGPTFPDVTATGDTALFYNHVEYLAGLGVVQGFWDGKYHPEKDVRRDQMALYIQRAFELPIYPQ